MNNPDAYTAAKLRQRAAEARTRSRESFERSGTDGYLTQAAASAEARRLELQAHIAECGGAATFTGLYEGDRRVKAKEVATRFGMAWKLHEDEAELIRKRGGRNLIPMGVNSKVQRALGLRERLELAAAYSTLAGGPGGPSVQLRRGGSQWGTDAQLVPEPDLEKRP